MKETQETPEIVQNESPDTTEIVQEPVLSKRQIRDAKNRELKKIAKETIIQETIARKKEEKLQKFLEKERTKKDNVSRGRRANVAVRYEREAIRKKKADLFDKWLNNELTNEEIISNGFIPKPEPVKLTGAALFDSIMRKN